MPTIRDVRELLPLRTRLSLQTTNTNMRNNTNLIHLREVINAKKRLYEMIHRNAILEGVFNNEPNIQNNMRRVLRTLQRNKQIPVAEHIRNHNALNFITNMNIRRVRQLLGN